MKIEITGDNYEIDSQITAYVNKKLNKLKKKMSKHQKEAVHAIVRLKEHGSDPSSKYEAEIILRLPPKEELIAKEATMNMFAAVDIAEAKIATQFAKYKDKYDSNKTDRKGTLARLRSMADRDYWGKQD